MHFQNVSDLKNTSKKLLTLNTLLLCSLTIKTILCLKTNKSKMKDFDHRGISFTMCCKYYGGSSVSTFQKPDNEQNEVRNIMNLNFL